MITIILLILTAVLWGSAPIIEKIGLTSGTNPFTAIAIRSFSITVVLLIICSIILLTGKAKDILVFNGRTIIIFAASGIIAGLLGMWTYFSALKSGAVSKIVPIAASYPLVTTLLGITILKEEVTFLRILGTLLIITGIWLVK